jgi:beta-alanine--pyruvate transaminase
MKDEGLFVRAGQQGRVLGDAMHSVLKGLPNVVSIRTLGLAGAVELAPAATGPGKRAYDIMLDCFHHGVWLRAAGDNIVICPPYIVDNAQIDQMVQTLADSIRRHA